VIAGNGAIWVVLNEQPGWEFLTHPQLWLIPPAASVLAAAQVLRHRMSEAMLAAVRYAAMLVIYVSSTADLLVKEIGTSLSGPIILILLALAGVIAGIILEVRAFLFLGTAFVLVAVLSMVWHAQRAIGQVWPWWVFGISTGLLLLAALILIERFRPAVQELAARLEPGVGGGRGEPRQVDAGVGTGEVPHGEGRDEDAEHDRARRQPVAGRLLRWSRHGAPFFLTDNESGGRASRGRLRGRT
jgi:hypothetical protein